MLVLVIVIDTDSDSDSDTDSDADTDSDTDFDYEHDHEDEDEQEYEDEQEQENGKEATKTKLTHSIHESSQEKAVAIARLADENKADDIQVLGVGKVCNFTDYFVIATCNSSLQLRGLGHKIERYLRDLGERAFRVAGYDTTTWIVQDYGDVVVHLLSVEARDHYRIEALWRDASRVDWAAEAQSAVGSASARA